MLKKILIGVGILIVLLFIAYLYLDNRNRSLSPPGSTALENDGISVEITYSKPSVRDRLIFGEEAEGALQPYGVYWRLGANEPTDIDVNVDFLFDGKQVNAGKYVLYAIPRKGEMEIRINSDLRMWGYSEPDAGLDITSTVIRTSQVAKEEQFTITTEPTEGGVNVVFDWDTYRWILPITRQ